MHSLKVSGNGELHHQGAITALQSATRPRPAPASYWGKLRQSADRRSRFDHTSLDYDRHGSPLSRFASRQRGLNSMEISFRVPRPPPSSPRARLQSASGSETKFLEPLAYHMMPGRSGGSTGRGLLARQKNRSAAARPGHTPRPSFSVRSVPADCSSRAGKRRLGFAHLTVQGISQPSAFRSRSFGDGLVERVMSHGSIIHTVIATAVDYFLK